jgi:hypothetical protein
LIEGNPTENRFLPNLVLSFRIAFKTKLIAVSYAMVPCAKLG